jgi:hypothetical protein
MCARFKSYCNLHRFKFGLFVNIKLCNRHGQTEARGPDAACQRFFVAPEAKYTDVFGNNFVISQLKLRNKKVWPALLCNMCVYISNQIEEFVKIHI